MSGIYIHIPFCKQACHYCDFHFSTSLKKKDALLFALTKELQLRKNELAGETVTSLYFGGGTPSMLKVEEIRELIRTVYTHYKVAPDAEITLEANPDDLNPEKIRQLAGTAINRLSIGIQSFAEAGLKLMNRAHTAGEAKKSLETASTYFNNISVDLIYGIPGMTPTQWQHNLETALSYPVSHIAAYALTVEPGTALAAFIKKGKVAPPDDGHARQQFFLLIERLEARNFIHYEVSNFGKEGFFSRHNSAYWQGKKYMGIGPSAHSYNGTQRSWNIASNPLYIAALAQDKRPATTETLSPKDRYNEYIMTGLRTIWGVSLTEIERTYGAAYKDRLLQQAQKYIAEGLLSLNNEVDANGETHRILKTTGKGKFLSDGIASDLFLLHLQ